jgi:uncharacterized protein YuzE
MVMRFLKRRVQSLSHFEGSRECRSTAIFLRDHTGLRAMSGIHRPRGQTMKLHYYPETDSLYIELKSAPGTQTREIVDGLNVDLDANGDVVGFDIDHASGPFQDRDDCAAAGERGGVKNAPLSCPGRDAARSSLRSAASQNRDPGWS